ncbi:uncharacterized protein ColSpa_09935 [Colletotrichum spaethianum]|uniref:Aflatoxin regulatory protein domain-containing protein n=1 Tax=Colletotrichum spaethianum TaxID=700344 RepID=A0AA37UJJ3_9PEZI|nr:uncharacterized protein ColSpa_09935 [Colletotrichum spaethianum]GKT49754.1 hypothetical protein ColSpa_09935 [Colletotrichum spaethianum]
MPTRTEYNAHLSSCQMSFTPDLLPLFDPSTADSLGLSDGDTAWMFEPDADPAHEQMQFTDLGSTDIQIPDVPDLELLPSGDIHMHADTDADLGARRDSPGGYQTSNGSSLSVPASRSTSASSPSSSSVAYPGFPLPFQAMTHTGQRQGNLCTSQRCLSAALRILTALHIAHSACLSAHREDPTIPQTRKMETVLSMNKDVIAAMGPILACSCSAKSLVQLPLLSICGNLIAWNRAMISASINQGDDPFLPTTALCAGPTKAPEARVLPQPITIGQHQISGKLGRALHNQVMAGELRILEGLVDALSRRFGETSGSDGASGTSPTAAHARNVNGRETTAQDTHLLQSRGLPPNVHRHIISSLRTRLEHTRGMIFSHG